MNSRRLIRCPIRLEAATLPHCYAKTLLCITAKLSVEWQRWVMRVRPEQATTSPDVRFNSDSVRTSAAWGIDAKCHERAHAMQQRSKLLRI
jgi:hypothetical protein